MKKKYNFSNRNDDALDFPLPYEGEEEDDEVGEEFDDEDEEQDPVDSPSSESREDFWSEYGEDLGYDQ